MQISSYINKTSLPSNEVCQQSTNGTTALGLNAIGAAVSCMPRRTLEVHKGTANRRVSYCQKIRILSLENLMIISKHLRNCVWQDIRPLHRSDI